MIRVNQIKLPIEHNDLDIKKSILKNLEINENELISYEIEKKSIDARKKPDIYYIYSFMVNVKNESKILNRTKNKKSNSNIQKFERKQYSASITGTKKMKSRPVIIGSGPAGLFCAYQLAQHNYKPILLERGSCVEQRVKDVNEFWETGKLNPESNVQFGEGGAGTFSDGKLNTGVKDPFGRNREILDILVENGAPSKILYEGKPHIGTDILTEVVSNMRKKIISWGGDVNFNSKVTQLTMEGDVDNKYLTGLYVNDEKYIETQVAVLAIGNSARDTFEYLNKVGVFMEAKAFALGVRIEHKQHLINESQYGVGYHNSLEPTSYKLTANLDNGYGVYSFCMCPGGYVVNASSENEGTVVNGMSYSDRGGVNANSAIVVTIRPEDYGKDHPLNGMYLQRDIEKAAYKIGNGKVPVQLWKDFVNNVESKEIGTVIPQIKGEYKLTNIRQILPELVGDSIVNGVERFGRKIKGFDNKDTLISGVETRTSSPIKIPRNTEFESNIKGVYPCGEGAGYAGGITSAAIDGVKVFETIVGNFSPLEFDI